MSNNLFTLDVASRTDVGRRRPHNEDSMISVIPEDQQILAHKGALFIVADGLGGHDKGEVASKLTVETVSHSYYHNESESVSAQLLQAIHYTNTVIYEQIDTTQKSSWSAMGSTCIAAVIHSDTFYIANIGDSRAYLIRDNALRQISQDHSWVAEQVRAGILTEEQARIHQQRNIITRCLGPHAEVEVDLFEETMHEGDTLLLCSDGLSGLVEDSEILDIVTGSTPQESVERLIALANERGGSDNITIIVGHVCLAQAKE
jgi:serine/threonine protein phosphatase PrpC